MRLIDADAALQDANLNYGGLYDIPLVKYFIEKQPTVDINNINDSDGCDSCNNKRCSTCVYAIQDEYSEPCDVCSKEKRKYEPYNFCPHCGKSLRK